MFRVVLEGALALLSDPDYWQYALLPAGIFLTYGGASGMLPDRIEIPPMRLVRIYSSAR